MKKKMDKQVETQIVENEISKTTNKINGRIVSVLLDNSPKLFALISFTTVITTLLLSVFKKYINSGYNEYFGLTMNFLAVDASPFIQNLIKGFTYSLSFCVFHFF